YDGDNSGCGFAVCEMGREITGSEPYAEENCQQYLVDQGNRLNPYQVPCDSDRQDLPGRKNCSGLWWMADIDHETSLQQPVPRSWTSAEHLPEGRDLVYPG